MDLSGLVRQLGEMLGEVIVTQESQGVFEIEERIRLLAKARREGDANAANQLPQETGSLSNDLVYVVAAAFALYFDLVNIAEEVYRINALRSRRDSEYPRPIRNSIGAALQTLKSGGASEADIRSLLSSLSIELVLTSHPTQSKRRSLLSRIEKTRSLVDRLWQASTPKGEKQKIESDLRAAITTLWLSDRERKRQPDVTDEVRTGLYIVGNIFWDALPRIYRDLDANLAYYYPGVSISHPWLKLASWVGGDRDGNPNVTHTVTAETLRLHRGLAVEKHRLGLSDLARQMTISDRHIQPSPELQTWFNQRRPLPDRVAFLVERYPHEPYRHYLALIEADLAAASQEDMTSHLLDDVPHSAVGNAQELEKVLNLVVADVPEAIAQSDLQDRRTQVAVFGLHAARLDIREHADRINAAVAESLGALGVHADFESLDLEQRLEVLGEQLGKPAKPLNDVSLSPETAETWALFKLLAKAISIYGKDLFGPFIISMARNSADILAVLLLAHWAGCAEDIEIAPLFETIEDLKQSPEVLAQLFKHPLYSPHLEHFERRQMVMLGYSDSNKDGGYLASQWCLYQAQEQIDAICAQNNVHLTLFHGRGGSVARGGGPANRAIEAQPPGTLSGRFRVTEQGETVDLRYGDPDLAYRHLEQMVHAVLMASAPKSQRRQASKAWRETVEVMAATAMQAFTKLVHKTPGFPQFWREVTPLEEIARLHLSSRPASRGDKMEFENVRAIPWVFSWMQSRFNLAGWFGLGSGLQSAQSPALLKEMYAEWPFFKALLDNSELSLVKADMGIAEIYLSLVTDQAVAKTIFDAIRAEYDHTVQHVLAIKQQNNLLDADPVVQRSVLLRNPYVDPLNFLQVEVLRRLRARPDQEDEESERLRSTVVLTINGIAAGLLNTG